METDWSDQIDECEAKLASERNEAVREEIAELIHHHPVLEVGCGTQEFRKHVPDGEYVGVDITPEFHPDHVGDARELPFEDGSFPTVMTKNVIQHVEDWKTAIQECARVAAGRVVHCERTYGGDTTLRAREPITRYWFNPADFMEAMHGTPASYDCRTDHRLTIFVGRAA